MCQWGHFNIASLVVHVDVRFFILLLIDLLEESEGAFGTLGNIYSHLMIAKLHAAQTKMIKECVINKSIGSGSIFMVQI